jgi:hypothetical protein
MNVGDAKVPDKMLVSIGGRHHAAEILRKVADAGSWGGFPPDVTCDQLGQALEHICANAPFHDPLALVVKGWQKAAELRASRLTQVHIKVHEVT